jgi:hypothetical protein
MAALSGTIFDNTINKSSLQQAEADKNGYAA